jgi:DNA-binding CsgD family transcriptional regulator
LQLGETFLDMEELKTAEGHFNNAVALAIEIKKPEAVSTAYKHLSTIYEKQGKFNQAFDFLSRHKVISDSVYSAGRAKQIAEMQARFDSENKEKEIILLKQEKALNQTYLILALGAVVFTAIISLLIVNRQKMKIRSERELSEKEAQLMEERKTLYEAELKNRELAEQQLHDQLEYKNKELASYTLNLIQKNEILENLKEAVEEIKSAPEGMVKQKLTSLVNMVNYSFHLDRDWENFKIHFEQVHQDFFKKLIERYPDLSANDLKLCSLIKLNLDNKGIAAILNISQESAKVARHRLRKKLELAADQTLIAFLNNVENEAVETR